MASVVPSMLYAVTYNPHTVFGRTHTRGFQCTPGPRVHDSPYN